MQPLTARDLYRLEDYARTRNEYRARVMQHKRRRKLAVGPDAMLCFEDRLTIQYQVQEMLRVERIFEPDAIQEELDAYNPLIPDGGNLKATFMLEYTDPGVRQRRLAALRGIETSVWVRVGEGEPVFAIADEDLDRENEEKTSSVHFLRFELGEAAARRLGEGAPLAVGIDHASYRHAVDPVDEEIRASLAADVV